MDIPIQKGKLGRQLIKAIIKKEEKKCSMFADSIWFKHTIFVLCWLGLIEYLKKKRIKKNSFLIIINDK